MVQLTLDCQVAVVPLALTNARVTNDPLRLALGRADELDPQ